MAYLLVLGAKSDIAQAVAHIFAKNGFNLYLAEPQSQDLEKHISDFAIRYDVKVQIVEFDALDYASHKSFYESLPEKPLGVFCAVGLMGDNEQAKKDFDHARRIFDTNFTGLTSIINIAAQDMKSQGHGFIIGTSSVAGDRGRKNNFYYGAAKAALTTYLSGLRASLSKSDVSVITVKPGFVNTRMTEGMKLPGPLVAQPEEVARDIFLAWRKRKEVVYTKWFWRYIMFIIRFIPERIFKRLNF